MEKEGENVKPLQNPLPAPSSSAARSSSSSDLSALSSLCHDGCSSRMENLDKSSNKNEKIHLPIQSYSRNPSAAKLSPSPSSSDMSPLSSLSHGSSMDKDKPPDSPPLKLQTKLRSQTPAESPSSSDPGQRSSSPPLPTVSFPAKHPVVNQKVREDPPPPVTKVDRGAGVGVTEGGGGSDKWRVRQTQLILRKAQRENRVKRIAFGVRIFGLIFCLVSLSVMAADKNEGWALDSFYRYKEFRYCISVNVVGLLYSVAQTCDMAITMFTGKYLIRHQYRFYFDFAMDQILTYLLMSASSSAATRVDNWEANWGKDTFPEMANISVGMSFTAFVAFSGSTLISGYALCSWSS